MTEVTFKIASIDSDTGKVMHFEHPALAIFDLSVGDVRRKFVAHDGNGAAIGQTILSDFATGYGVKPYLPFVAEMDALGIAGKDNLEEVGQYIIDRLCGAMGADALINKLNSMPVVNFEN